MKKSLYVLSMIFTLLLVTNSIVNAGPGFELSETGFNFGKVVQHAQVSHTFWIKSTGDEPLIITGINPGCGCTKAPIGDTIIAPGEKTPLEIILDTKSYRGYVSKKPFFKTNVSDEYVFLRIDAELMVNPADMTPLQFDPPKLDISQFTETPRRKASFKVTNVYDRDYKITMLDIDNKHFDVELPDHIKAGETIEGKVIVHEDSIDKEFNQSFTIQVDDDFRTKFSLPIERTIKILKK